MKGRGTEKLAVELAPGSKPFYGWTILAACVLVMTVISGLAAWSFGLYVRPIEDEFGWSRAQVSLGFSVAILVAGFAGPAIGVWIDRYGPRSALIVGSAMTGATYILLAFTETLWQWYLFSAINAGFRQMTFFIPMQVLVSRWFDRRRGAALSILGTGFSLGGFLILPLLAFVIDVTSWRTGFVFSGAMAVGVVIPIGLLVLRDWPSDKGTVPDGQPNFDKGTRTEDRDGGGGLTLGEALKLRFFWVLSSALALFFFGLIGWTVHIVPFLESRGISQETAALLISASSGAGIGTRLMLGFVADRFNRFEIVSSAFTALLAVAMASLFIGGWTGVVLFFTFWLVGSSAGALAEGMNLTRAFGLANFATILGAVVVIETCAEVLSPWLAGVIFDETGSYDLALVMYVCSFLASTALFLVASRMALPAWRSRIVVT